MTDFTMKTNTIRELQHQIGLFAQACLNAKGDELVRTEGLKTNQMLVQLDTQLHNLQDAFPGTR